jgi:SAM-dependent methyltransferase
VTTEEAIRQLRSDPRSSDLVRDSYLGLDVLESGERFVASAEFAAVKELLAGRICGATVLDLGAGVGIGSYAMAKSGARLVYALEPDPSNEIGRGAIRHLNAELPVRLVGALGENIPLPDAEVDIVYVRQVLHHSRDLSRLIGECARVLKHGGIFLACREHVVDDDHQLKLFLQNHPVHRLAGGEAAFPLDGYLEAVRQAGLELVRAFGPYDTVINAFPEVRSRRELDDLPRLRLTRRLGWIGFAGSFLPGVRWMLWKRIKRQVGQVPGRMYSFLATKL